MIESKELIRALLENEKYAEYIKDGNYSKLYANLINVPGFTNYTLEELYNALSNGLLACGIKFLDKIKDIYPYSFYKTTMIYIDIPSNVESIRVAAFSESSIENVTLHDGLIKIGAAAFKKSKLQSLECPSTLKEIDTQAFYGCKDLTSVKLNEGLESIGDFAFANCNLDGQVIEIPKSIKHIENGAFTRSNAKFIYNGTRDEFNNGSILDGPSTGIEFTGDESEWNITFKN